MLEGIKTADHLNLLRGVRKQHNACIFEHSEAPAFIVTAKIRDIRASIWIEADEKHLNLLVGRGWVFY